MARARLLGRREGFTAEPSVLAGTLGGNSEKAYPVRLTARADAPLGVSILAFDATLDGRRYGEWFDMVVQSEE